MPGAIQRIHLLFYVSREIFNDIYIDAVLKLTALEHIAHSCAAKRAGTIVRRAVQSGLLPNLKLIETACRDCGNRATVYDHRDYAKPLDVEPVCYRCNSKRGPAKWELRIVRFYYPKEKSIPIVHPKQKSIAQDVIVHAESDGESDLLTISVVCADAPGDLGRERKCLWCNKVFVPRIEQQTYCCQTHKNTAAQCRWRRKHSKNIAAGRLPSSTGCGPWRDIQRQ